MWRIARRLFSTREEIQQRLFDVVKRFDNFNAEKLSDSASFEDLGMDSLDTVEAVVMLED